MTHSFTDTEISMSNRLTGSMAKTKMNPEKKYEMGMYAFELEIDGIFTKQASTYVSNAK